ncbi:Polyphosphate kinase [Aquirufa nivalisilvae]|uniref:Polyphosphate kinase n=1 Tax=Aquirufa nivalisilvae TaxID=2516557 RepID=A0A2S2DWM7_9BACT|nr:polyphosphate kinase 1 [Aquirufa nivalisilvae]AWL09795.1 Polyphosphate kinase [Aquirufa nivalisilvae]
MDHSNKAVKHSDTKDSSTGNLLSLLKPKNWKINLVAPRDSSRKVEKAMQKSKDIIAKSKFISRDLSWLKFDERVLDQARDSQRTLFDRLKFLAITASNLDEFFTIRIGSLYNYIDFGKERTDYSGLREIPFKQTLIAAAQEFSQEKHRLFVEEILPLFPENGLLMANLDDLTSEEMQEVETYFHRTIYPMLTPMVFDHTHTFPSLLAKTLIFGVVTVGTSDKKNHGKHKSEKDKKISFVQIPLNLARFYVIERDDKVLFLPIEQLIRHHLQVLYRNVEIEFTTLFRITRNGDFDVVEHEDAEIDFVDEIKKKIKDRRLGRVTRVEVEKEHSEFLLEEMLKRWSLEKSDIFIKSSILDFTAFWQIVKHPDFKGKMAANPPVVPALGLKSVKIDDIFETMKRGDILLHHPYNNFDPVVQLLDQAADDPHVLAIKITLYRISKNSRISHALLRAAEQGKHVSVLFEVKARFDEENNIREATKLQKAGCFVIYGIPGLKTHTKLLQVIRNEGNYVMSYAHLSSGNYNEDTAKLYTDIGLLTTDSRITQDISEFFNVITGHSMPTHYEHLITAPRDMRNRLLEMIRTEMENHQNGLPSGICLKINSLQDTQTMEMLYEASQAGVPVLLIVRGICCLRPQRKGLSENIYIKSIVGNYLEHTRIFYFHNAGEPKVYGGSADVMVRSFDRRIESLFELVNPRAKNMAITILLWNLRDTINSYEMQEDGSYWKVESNDPFNIHQAFYEIKEDDLVSQLPFDQFTVTLEGKI